MAVIYLDSCLLIYVIDGAPPFQTSAATALGASQSVDFAISPLVKAECLVGPLRAQDRFREKRFLDLFSRFHTLPITEAIFIAAARLRAAHGVKLPDALHLACAQAHGCTALWTNDDRLAAAAPGFAVAIV